MSQSHNKSLETLNLQQAAAVLKMSPNELGRKARKGLVPASKPGKHWVFIEEDLASYLRGKYHSRWQAPSERGILCQEVENEAQPSFKEAKAIYGGIVSQTQNLESKFAKARAQLKEMKRRKSQI